MASPWHKYDGINTMAQKGEPAPNDSIRHTKAHPGFQSVQRSIAQREGVSSARAGAILGAATRRAGASARRSNPRLNRVNGGQRGR